MSQPLSSAAYYARARNEILSRQFIPVFNIIHRILWISRALFWLLPVTDLWKFGQLNGFLVVEVLNVYIDLGFNSNLK